MSEIVKNIIVTVLILFVMRLITVGIARNIEQEKIDEEEAKLSKKERKNLNNPYLTGKIIIEYGKEIKALMIVAFIFFCLLFLGCATGFFYNVEIFSFVGSLLFVILGAIGVGGTVFWRIKVDGDNIEYFDYLGIKHHYKFSELDKVVACLKKTKVYKNGGLVFTIDDNVPNGHYFTSMARKQGVNVIIDKSLQDYADKNGIK